MNRRKALAAEWKRLEATLPVGRLLTKAEMDELIARWSAIVDRVYSHVPAPHPPATGHRLPTLVGVVRARPGGHLR